MSIVQQLSALGHHVKYICFDQSENRHYCQDLNIECKVLGPLHSAEVYIGQKLHSEMLASWIVKTSFFKSLFDMVPAISHLIFLGHIINELEKNPDLILVFDSPSSGHALTMFEASFNFKKIFKSGVIFNDILRMHEFIYRPGLVKVIIPTLPTQLSLEESLEVQSFFYEIQITDVTLVANQCIGLSGLDISDLSTSLSEKIKNEENLIQMASDHLKFYIPLIPSLDLKNILKAIGPRLNGVIC